MLLRVIRFLLLCRQAGRRHSGVEGSGSSTLGLCLYSQFIHVEFDRTSLRCLSAGIDHDATRVLSHLVGRIHKVAALRGRMLIRLAPTQSVSHTMGHSRMKSQTYTNFLQGASTPCDAQNTRGRAPLHEFCRCHWLPVGSGWKSALDVHSNQPANIIRTSSIWAITTEVIRDIRERRSSKLTGSSECILC